MKQVNLNFKTDHKIKSIPALESTINDFRLYPVNVGSRVVLTTGVFDLIHPGHIDYLNKAKVFGELLVVTIVDDQFVQKKPGQPIFNQNLRLQWLAALEVVDYVVLNGDYGPWKTMRAIRPDVYVKGYNLTPGLLKDFELARDLGVCAVLIPEVMHSSEIFEEINKL